MCIRSEQKHIMVCGDGFWGVLIRRGEHSSLFVRVVDHISPYEQTLLLLQVRAAERQHGNWAITASAEHPG